MPKKCDKEEPVSGEENDPSPRFTKILLLGLTLMQTPSCYHKIFRYSSA